MIQERKRSIETARRFKNVNQDFLSNLTHEFITPLSVISINLQILEKLESKTEKPSSTKKVKYLTNIRNQVERLNEAVHDAIDLLKLDTFNEQVELAEADIVEMLEAIISSIGLCNHKILFRSNLFVDKLIINTDQRLLRSSIFRLVNHACITHRNNVPELIVNFQSDTIRIEVLNHDLRLDEEDFHHIFRPFNRTTEMEKVEGMSLALTIIRTRLRLIGADIKVSTLENGGVKYSIELPVKKA